jgi:diguanylate cyclase (GGDEF)-like protein
MRLVLPRAGPTRNGDPASPERDDQQKVTTSVGDEALPTTRAAAAVLRIVGAVDVYLYTNEHRADGSRRSVFSGPNREKLMGGRTPVGADTAAEWERLIHPDDWDLHLAHRERLRRGEPSDVRYRLRGYDGVVRWISARTRSTREGTTIVVDGIVSDVTREVEAELRLAAALEQLELLAAANAQQALHDALTGLGNRRKLLLHLEAAFASGGPWLLALFDLDGFKRYNDTFGHPAGDDLLARLASRLQAAMPADSAFRFGGDEFLVLAPADGDVEKLLHAANDALTEEGEGFSITASFGAVFPDEESRDAAAALRLCDQRLYNQKSQRASQRGRPEDVLLEALSAREPHLEHHSTDVAYLAVGVGERLGLSQEELVQLKQVALLHDIGKIGIPDSILGKPGPLTDAEWTMIRRHTVIGERIAAASPALAEIASVIRSTHERIDGAGYPDQLCGDEIPLAARIVFACDAYSAMTADRSYRSPREKTVALAELDRCAGSQFDPIVVRELSALVSRQLITHD